MVTATSIKFDDTKHRATETLGEHVRVSVVDMGLHALKILRFRSFSFCCQLVSLSFDCLP